MGLTTKKNITRKKVVAKRSDSQNSHKHKARVLSYADVQANRSKAYNFLSL